MATRKAITRGLAVRYRDGSRELKGEILDTVCGLTGYHRDYARRALRFRCPASSFWLRNRDLMVGCSGSWCVA